MSEFFKRFIPLALVFEGDGVCEKVKHAVPLLHFLAKGYLMILEDILASDVLLFITDKVRG